jgi:colicin import membrane protein
MARNAYILSGILHAAALGLLFLLAQMPVRQLPPVRRYQPVHLMAPIGPPGSAAKSGRKVDLTKPAPPEAKTEVKPKETLKPETKPVPKSSLRAKEGGKQAPTSTASKSGGGGGGSVNLDGANFPYPYYLSNIQIKILSNFKPAVSGKQAKELKAVVFFVIDKGGRISEVKLEDKSGQFLFDQEAQRAVLRSNPLPALPPAFEADRLGVHFEFVGSP